MFPWLVKKFCACYETLQFINVTKISFWYLNRKRWI